MDQNKKTERLIEGAAERLTRLVDVDTVIGKPIFSTSGTQIIPLAKVTRGYRSGGGGDGAVKPIQEDETAPFAGGAGTVINVKPAGFRIDDGVECRLVRIPDDPLDGLIEKASDLLNKLVRREDNAE